MYKIVDIPPPQGAKRVEVKDDFGRWLRELRLRNDNRVFLYNGNLKDDQSNHYVVIDISRGTRDLQQCADAIMRLRAEFFYGRDKYDSIRFYAAGKTALVFSDYKKGYRYHVAGNRIHSNQVSSSNCENRKCFMQYMETVFAFSGTYNLYEQLKPRPIMDMQPGDVFVQAGSPGHAMIVADMVINESNGKKYFILAQGYMPAQDMHIVVNPANSNSPWFELNPDGAIITPYWKFSGTQLRCW